MYLGSESVGETPQLGDAAFDLSGCSERARETAEASGAGIATLMETLCRQAEVWYGCEAFNNDCFYEGRVGGWNIMPNGSWIFMSTGTGTARKTSGSARKFCRVKMLADTPAGTDLFRLEPRTGGGNLAGAGARLRRKRRKSSIAVCALLRGGAAGNYRFGAKPAQCCALAFSRRSVRWKSIR